MKYYVLWFTDYSPIARNWRIRRGSVRTRRCRSNNEYVNYRNRFGTTACGGSIMELSERAYATVRQKIKANYNFSMTDFDRIMSNYPLDSVPF